MRYLDSRKKTKRRQIPSPPLEKHTRVNEQTEMRELLRRIFKMATGTFPRAYYSTRVDQHYSVGIVLSLFFIFFLTDSEKMPFKFPRLSTIVL